MKQVLVFARAAAFMLALSLHATVTPLLQSPLLQSAVQTVSRVPMPTLATGAGLFVVATLPVTMNFDACPFNQDQLVASAKDVLSVLKSSSVQNALTTLAPGVLGKVTGAIPTAERLVEAIRKGDFTDATSIVNTLFPLVDEIADALKATPKVMAFIALANIGLHFIINHVQAATPRTARRSPEVQKAIEFGDQPVWGCDLRKDKRCAALK